MLVEEHNEKLQGQKTMYTYQLEQGRNRILEVEAQNATLKKQIEEARSQGSQRSSVSDTKVREYEDELEKLRQ